MSISLQTAVLDHNAELVKSLLDSGEDPNELPLDVSPMMLAACLSDLEIVKLLISNPHKPVDPNAFTHFAIKANNINLVDLLLTKSLIEVDVDFEGREGCTPLALAVNEKNGPIVKLLLEAESNPNIRDTDGYTPINNAIKNRDAFLVKLLLRESLIKVNVHSHTSEGYTPLGLAVYEKHFAITKLLLEAESDPNISDFDGYAPIHYAAQSGDIALVQLLLTESLIKVNVNLESCQGHTPLHLAQKIAIVKLLLEVEADPNICDGDCYAPIHYAVQNGNSALVQLFLTESVINMNVDLQECTGCTPLVSAIRVDNVAIAKLLLDAGADIYFPNNDWYYAPFRHALMEKKFNMCKLLIEYGYEVNMPTLDGCHSAVYLDEEYDVDSVRYLVEECKADIFAEQGKVIGDPISSKRPEVLDYLLQYGYELRGDEIWWKQRFPQILHEALCHRSLACIQVLLRWGLNNAAFNIQVLDLHFILQHFLKFDSHTSLWMAAPCCFYVIVIKLLKEMYPQCLQEHSFIGIRNDLNRFSFCPEMKNLLPELYAERKDPARLNAICRTKIFQQLGYNAVSKAEKLPFPRSLINFVQFREVEDLYDDCLSRHYDTINYYM